MFKSRFAQRFFTYFAASLAVALGLAVFSLSPSPVAAQILLVWVFFCGVGTGTAVTRIGWDEDPRNGQDRNKKERR